MSESPIFRMGIEMHCGLEGPAKVWMPLPEWVVEG